MNKTLAAFVGTLAATSIISFANADLATIVLVFGLVGTFFFGVAS